MVNLKPDVVAALKADPQLAALVGDRVYFFYPQVAPVYPLITYYELSNRAAAHADNCATFAEIVMVINVISDRSTTVVSQHVERIMRDLGFVQDLAHDLHEDGIFVRNMRFVTYKEVV